MRRYRKGQVFKPPSAAEHAAHADAAAAHRRAPSKPQDLAPVGQAIYVLTPEGGINARDDTTIYSALCKRLIETDGPDGTLELVETDEEYRVYNFATEKVDGDAYVMTALTFCGTRYAVVSASKLVELCAQETATRNTPYEALLGTWDPSESKYCYDGAPTVMAVDHRYGMPLAETGSKGLYQAMPSSVEGHDGTLYVCVSLDCEAPPEGCNECEGA